MTADAQGVEPQLSWERRARVIGAVGALVSVALQLAALAVNQSISEDAPRGRSARAILEVPGFVHAHATELLVVSIIGALGLVAMIPPLEVLYRATKFRRPELPSLARATIYAGPLLLGGALVALQVAVNAGAADYVAQGRPDAGAARRVFTEPGQGPVGFVRQLGLVTLVFAFVLVAVNAMRVGLLTRFMGVLGIFVGLLEVLQYIGAGSPVILRSFWLGALALLLVGRWPGGVPKAWSTGQAEPWPTAREMREQRERERQAAGGGEGEEPANDALPPAPAHRPETTEPHPRSRKRRGRRRR